MAAWQEPPFQDDLVDVPTDQRGKWRVSFAWLQWFLNGQARVEDSPERLTPASKTGQSAAIPTTALPVAALRAGLYRITYYIRITTPATVSSSLAVTLGFTDGATTCVFPFAALTTNLTSSVQSDSKLVHIDGASPVTYATAYASVGAQAMKYRIDVTVERVNEDA